MKHAVIINHNFNTACKTSFSGLVLKDKTFEHRPLAEIETIECQVCREKVIYLKTKTVYHHRGGRCIIIDI